MPQIDYTLTRGEDEISIIVNYHIERAEPDVGIMNSYVEWDAARIHQDGQWVDFELTEDEDEALVNWLNENVEGDDYDDDDYEPDYD